MNNENDRPPKKHGIIGIILIVIMFIMLMILAVLGIIDKVKNFLNGLKEIMYNSKKENLDLLKVYGIIIATSIVIFFILKFLQKHGVILESEKKSKMIEASVITGGMICALAFMAFLVYDAVKG